ncbi:hypothetical protein [Paenibacillus kobensis]|uniref:hypothetical protein n=1 Tax=Paenibacillus kobensis TaxID=59841 RepID=UPI000FD6F07D|nr:hypothetical protein [Paenibacillus kobensis]
MMKWRVSVNGKRVSREKACRNRIEQEEVQVQEENLEEQDVLTASGAEAPAQHHAPLTLVRMQDQTLAKASMQSWTAKRERLQSPARTRHLAWQQVVEATGTRLRANNARRGTRIISSRKMRRSCAPIRVPPA